MDEGYRLAWSAVAFAASCARGWARGLSLLAAIPGVMARTTIEHWRKR